MQSELVTKLSCTIDNASPLQRRAFTLRRFCWPDATAEDLMRAARDNLSGGAHLAATREVARVSRTGARRIDNDILSKRRLLIVCRL